MGPASKLITAQKKKEFKQMMKSKHKEKKTLLKTKRARLIVKNLPFQVTEESLKEHFEKYGVVKEVQLLKREDSKLVGCGFVQFDAVQQAAKAKHYTNGKPFLGREITCDFVLAKKQFLKKQKQEKWKNKKENDLDSSQTAAVILDDEVKIKKEEDDEETVNNNEINDNSKNEDDDGKDEDDYDDDDDDVDSMHSNDISSETKIETKPISKDIKKPFVSNDVNEGKTVFIKNLPFDATDNDLRECMQQFGPLYYAKICMDPMTEHSKGTGFVKFRNKEDAEKCLEAGTELQLLGNILDCHKALNKSDILKKTVKDNKIQSDNRNLYLMKEGLIMAGSPAAEGVSAADMAKRLQIEKYKSQMLRKLNMFVSKTRLIIHNLPQSFDNKKLKQLFLKYAGPKAVITEARIMRDMFNVNEKGQGASKEYAFVNFTTSEHALNALRLLNNNPKIWTSKRRPIVGFSIENRDMIKAKENRTLVSKRKNPLSKDFNPKEVKDRKPIKLAQAEDNDFAGYTAKPGVNKMRSKHNLNTEAKLHHQQLNTEKLKKKLERKRKTDKFTIKQPKQTQNPKRQIESVKDDDFAKMVNSYKVKLMNSSKIQEKKGKWYE